MPVPWAREFLAVKEKELAGQDAASGCARTDRLLKGMGSLTHLCAHKHAAMGLHVLALGRKVPGIDLDRVTGSTAKIEVRSSDPSRIPDRPFLRARRTAAEVAVGANGGPQLVMRRQ